MLGMLVWMAAIVVQIENTVDPKNEVVNLLEACEETWRGGFKMYPSPFEWPEYPYVIECVNYFNGREKVWFEHYYDFESNKIKEDYVTSNEERG